jgi:chitinase
LGYFTNWAHHREAPCEFRTSDVDAQLFSHINYAFALIEPSKDKQSYRLIPSDPDDESRLYAEVNALKKENPHLRTLLSVGGWAFNDKPTEWIFSAMAETKARRQTFIESSLIYLRKYGFDGLDIDWEFPGAPDRGGRPQDTENFTALLREFRAAMVEEAKRSKRPELLLTIASPAGPFFYRHQQLDRIHEYLNFINVMTYDYHGNWENTTGANAPLTGEEVSIHSTVAAYLKAGVPKAKLVLGMATYARGWGGVQQPAPGATATGQGPDGPCGKESFSAHQVQDQIEEGLFEEKWDDVSKTPFAYSSELQAYLTYDNARSIDLKLKFLKNNELAGAMFWAIDLDDFKGGYPIISRVSRALRPPDSAAAQPTSAREKSE